MADQPLPGFDALATNAVAIAFKREMMKRVRPLLALDRSPALIGPIVRDATLFPAWRLGHLFVQTSVQRMNDGRDWYEVSFSRGDRIPSYEDILLVRRTFFQSSALVVQVFPPTAEHLNVHPRTLHLWQRLGEDRLIPDLRYGEEEYPADLQPFHVAAAVAHGGSR